MHTRLNKDSNFYRKLIKLTLPMAFQSLMLASVAAADSFMLGKIDQVSMSAVSLATQVQFVQNLFIFAISNSSVILGAQYWGKGDRKTLHDIFCMILRLSGSISLLVCLACELIPGVLMKFFTSDPSLISIGSDYLRIAGWSYLLTGVSQCYLTVMKMTDHAKQSAFISTASVLLNIVLNYVLIFGPGNFTALGSDGAALATTTARVIELGLAFIVCSGKKYIRPTVKGLLKRNRLLFSDYRKQLLPVTGAALLWGLGLTVYTSVIGHISVDATAANAVSAVVRELMCCLCNGISNAGEIIVGNELGAGRLETGKKYGIKVSVISLITGILTCLLVIAVSPGVVGFMTLEENASKLLGKMLVIMGVYMIARCINGVVINGVFAAGGDTAFDIYSLTVCMWLVSIPMSFLSAFVFRWSVPVVYIFTCFDEIVKVPWVFAHFRKYKWVRDLTRDNTSQQET